jgi:N-alpha-acetyltransferase 38, NatC auxiliary subunit
VAPEEISPGRQKLKSWLNKTLRIKMTDGRVLIGEFNCTDRDANVILSMTSEYGADDQTEERLIGKFTRHSP